VDNRTALQALGLTQHGWGQVCGVNPRTAERWFADEVTAPKLVWRLLRFFANHPRIFKTFQKENS
jgi:hypothetical protein